MQIGKAGHVEAKLQTQYYVGQVDHLSRNMTKRSWPHKQFFGVHFCHEYIVITKQMIQTFQFHNSVIHKNAPPYVCIKGIQTAPINGRHYITVFAKATIRAQKECKTFRSKSSRQTQLYGYIRSMKTARCDVFIAYEGTDLEFSNTTRR